ncbi:hypothetical protein DE146DRAFT_627596 [Phaeosphaeria sp. MPI-PUGE-AT-0046c]|nr:hypothetical protein DE146DRAFT_627596 [Phaeosphaeria sp. MPI-PUGE-AT-0046c]
MADQAKSGTNSRIELVDDPNIKRRSFGRTFSPNSLVLLARLVSSSVIAGFLPTVNSTFSVVRCCTLAVREEFHTYIDKLYPWEVCNFNTEIDYGNNETFPSIVRNLAWAKINCSGTQLSSLKQWLIPLSTYISPYIGILLLCPVGDISDHEFTKRKHLDNVLNGLRKPRQGYMSILGDPASATFGALHEVWSDARTLRRLTPENPEKLSWQHQRALWITTLAGDIQFSVQTSWDPNVTAALDASGEPLLRDCSFKNSGKERDTMGIITHQAVDMTLNKDKEPSPAPQPSPVNDASTEVDNINKAIEIMIIARKGFVGGILIPVLLMLAVTAATFYDAYSKRGDKDTGLALAYCVWYSWILVLGVAGNCYASSLNAEVAKRASDKRTWAELPNDHWNHRSAIEGLKSDWRFWFRFCGGQFIGFCCIAFSSACATAIAWTTPTVGLGCRSFNFILYVVFSFVTACMHVLCSWLLVRSKARQQSPDVPKNRNIPFLVARCIYWLLVFVNSLVIVLGTLFHLVGVFRTCWCERLTWSDSTLIELNSKTPQAVDNAGRYWLSTAYIAFGVVWLACLTAIAFRGFIVQKMDNWAEAASGYR